MFRICDMRSMGKQKFCQPQFRDLRPRCRTKVKSPGQVCPGIDAEPVEYPASARFYPWNLRSGPSAHPDSQS